LGVEELALPKIFLAQKKKKGRRKEVPTDTRYKSTRQRGVRQQGNERTYGERVQEARNMMTTKQQDKKVVKQHEARRQ
jgi:hypothetical protein